MIRKGFRKVSCRPLVPPRVGPERHEPWNVDVRVGLEVAAES
jgi:hypothetical protein